MTIRTVRQSFSDCLRARRAAQNSGWRFHHAVRPVLSELGPENGQPLQGANGSYKRAGLKSRRSGHDNTEGGWAAVLAQGPRIAELHLPVTRRTLA